MEKIMKKINNILNKKSNNDIRKIIHKYSHILMKTIHW